jgi:hypothetical protein
MVMATEQIASCVAYTFGDRVTTSHGAGTVKDSVDGLVMVLFDKGCLHFFEEDKLRSLTEVASV